jgi:hypothetical protein
VVGGGLNPREKGESRGELKTLTLDQPFKSFKGMVDIKGFFKIRPNSDQIFARLRKTHLLLQF